MASPSPLKPALRCGPALRGWGYGVFEPVVISYLTLPPGQPLDWAALDRAIESVVGRPVTVAADLPPEFPRLFAERALAIAIAILQAAGLPVFEQGRVLGTRPADDGRTTTALALPYSLHASQQAFGVLVWSVQTLVQLVGTRMADETVAKRRELLAKVMQSLEPLKSADTNLLRFQKAAHGAGIPFDWVMGPCYQYGWGANQCCLNSTILESTASMGVSMARDKRACAQILRRAGLPVPHHQLVATLEEAEKVAEKLGYPIVIKPVNLDGGVGVNAGLKDVEQLRQAWPETSKHGPEVLVEKHQEGLDFRLLVLDGKLVWAVGRKPAGVTGDGVATVEALVAQANLDPRRGFHATATLRPLQLDAEALALLLEQGGLTAQGVPPAGVFVVLRRAANISSGGTPLVVIDEVHPDNRDLVERAVSLLRLDLAGVDLIIPDIATSWRESGAAIIEINAQPQLVAASQTHLYRDILAARIPGDGRIPVVFFAGQGAAEQAGRVQRELSGLGVVSGLAGAGDVTLDGRVIGRRGMRLFDAVRAVLAQRDAQAVLAVIDDASILTSGLPVDRYDLLVLAEPKAEPNTVRFAEQLLQMAAPHCTGRVITASSRVADVLGRAALFRVPVSLAKDGASVQAEVVAWVQQRSPAAAHRPARE